MVRLLFLEDLSVQNKVFYDNVGYLVLPPKQINGAGMVLEIQDSHKITATSNGLSIPNHNTAALKAVLKRHFLH